MSLEGRIRTAGKLEVAQHKVALEAAPLFDALPAGKLCILQAHILQAQTAEQG